MMHGLKELFLLGWIASIRPSFAFLSSPLTLEKTQPGYHHHGLVRVLPMTHTPIPPVHHSKATINTNATGSKPDAAPSKATTIIDDPCAFEAASQEITSIIATRGSITETQIQRIVHDFNDFANNSVRKYFPGAIGSSQVLHKVQAVAPQFGITVDNTLFSQSVCPDEINHERGDITDIFIQWLSKKVFHLGGLGGIPFTGPTGFAAYSGHVPENGHCFILQAPHIGVTREGAFGKYCRAGQTEAGAACGAAIGAYNHCCAGHPLPDLTDANAMDQQMSWIIHQLSKRCNGIQKLVTKNDRQTQLVREMQSIGKERIDGMASVNFGGPNSRLFVLSGIQINMPHPFEDYFEPLSFEMHHKNGTITDLYAKTFL